MSLGVLAKNFDDLVDYNLICIGIIVNDIREDRLSQRTNRAVLTDAQLEQICDDVLTGSGERMHVVQFTQRMLYFNTSEQDVRQVTFVAGYSIFN